MVFYPLGYYHTMHLYALGYLHTIFYPCLWISNKEIFDWLYIVCMHKFPVHAQLIPAVALTQYFMNQHCSLSVLYADLLVAPEKVEKCWCRTK